MTTVSYREPRTITRLAYQIAISGAVSAGARADLVAALQWYELKWQAQDRAAQAQDMGGKDGEQSEEA